MPEDEDEAMDEDDSARNEDPRRQLAAKHPQRDEDHFEDYEYEYEGFARL